MATFITFSRSQNIRRSQQNLAQTEACDSGKREKTTYMPSTVSSLKKQKQNNKKKKTQGLSMRKLGKLGKLKLIN